MALVTVKLKDVPAFKYDGSKATIRPWIARWVPAKGRCYVEPFAGRGNVFFLLGRTCKFTDWHLNDFRTGTEKGFLNALLNVDVAQIPQHIRREDKDYWVEQRRLETPIGVLMEAVTTRNSMTYDCWSDAQGFHGSGQIIGPAKTRSEFQGSGDIVGGEVRLRTTYVRHHLTERVLLARETMQKCKIRITDIDYTKLPWTQYTTEDFAYLDPPYLSVNVGSYNEKDIDPEQLIHILKHTNCRWLMSEYEQPIYNKAFGKPVAEYITVQTMSPKGGHGPKKKEVLYSNYPIRFRPIRFERDSAASIHAITILAHCKNGIEVGCMDDRLINLGMSPAQVTAELVNLKYHPHVLYNGVKYWYMGK